MSDLYYLLAIFGCILIMLLCVFGNNANHGGTVVFADKPKRSGGYLKNES